MWILRIWLKWKRRRKRTKSVKKIEKSIYAFLYLNRALVKAGVSRTLRRQLKRDLITSNDPERILLRFLDEIEKVGVQANGD